MFGDLFEEGVTDRDYFGRLDNTLFTLFQIMTLEWADIVRQVRDKYWWASIVFFSFLWITSFILYSLIIAVVCDAVTVTEHHDEVAEVLQEKEETRKRVSDLQQQIEVMALHQQAVLHAVQGALLELNVGESSEFPTPSDTPSLLGNMPPPTQSIPSNAAGRDVSVNMNVEAWLNNRDQDRSMSLSILEESEHDHSGSTTLDALANQIANMDPLVENESKRPLISETTFSDMDPTHDERLRSRGAVVTDTRAQDSSRAAI